MAKGLDAGNLLVGAVLGTAVNPLLSSLTIGANLISPFQLPSIGQLASAYYSGRIDKKKLTVGLRCNGALLGAATVTELGDIWQDVITTGLPALGDIDLWAIAAQNANGSKFADDELKRTGTWSATARQAWLNRIGIPSWEWLYEQWRLGNITDGDFYLISGSMGLSGQTTLGKRLNATNPLSYAAAANFLSRGLVSNDQASKYFAAHYLTDPSASAAVIQEAIDSHALPLSDLLQMLRLGSLDPQTYGQLADRTGYKYGEWRTLAESKSTVFPAALAQHLHRRGLLSAQRTSQHLLAAGFVDQGDSSAVINDQYYNPTVQDWIRWSSRLSGMGNSGDWLGLNGEQSTTLSAVASATGFDTPPQLMPATDEPLLNGTPAELEWRAHWQQPGPAQVVAAIQQNNPARIRSLASAGIQAVKPTAEQLEQQLFAAGIPSGWRDTLLGLEFRTLPLRYVRNIATSGIAARQELFEIVQSLGYTPNDANTLLDTWEALDAQKEIAWIDAMVKQATKQEAESYIQGYELGYIPGPQAVQFLQNMGFTSDQAQQILVVADTKQQVAAIKSGIALIEKAFMHGEASTDQAAAQLSRLGLSTAAITRNIAQWQAQFPHAQKLDTTGQILAWLKDGVIQQQDAATRLENLGWSEVDTLTMLADTQGKVSKINASAQAAAQKKGSTAAKALASQVKAAQALTKQTQAALAKLASPSRLAKWWKEGIIDADQFLSQMVALGYPLSDAKLYLQQAYDESAAAKPSSPESAGASEENQLANASPAAAT
jgi:hypothetical protein